MSKSSPISALALAMLVLLMHSCAVKQAIALKDCQYEYTKLTDITFNDMTMSECRSITGIARIGKFILKPEQDATLGFTIHLKVTNPNKGTASLERLFYTVMLDSVMVGEGYSAEPFTVLGEASADLPLKLKVSMNQLLSKENRPVMVKTLKNVMGKGEDPTRITINLRPVIRVGNVALGIPKAIPLSFDYGG